MRYVRKKEECSGCRACEQRCPVNCIVVRPDEEGFLYPVIDEERCIDCKKCLEICNYEFPKSSWTEKIAYAVRNRNEVIRKESSSGGVFYELAMETIRRKGKIYGAAFDENYQVHQIGADTEEAIHAFMGSKYVQSDTGSSYQEVKALLDKDIFVLYSGTPCQIKGLKQYLKADVRNLLCVSLICHGVPSGMVWDRYVKLKMGHYAEGKPTSISFRDKTDGWRNMNLKMTFPSRCYSDIHSHDIYFQGFNQNLFLRQACYQCRAKERLDYADIIIGDFWGIEDSFPELDDGQGVSAVIINSEKGESYWQKIEDHFMVRECSVNDIVRRNPFLHGSVPENNHRESFFNELKETGLIEESIKDNLRVSIQKGMREQHQYELVKQYLLKKIKGDSIFRHIMQRGIHNICLYAITDLTELVTYELEKLKDCRLLYICDRNYSAYQKGIWGVRVVDQKHLISDVDNGVIDLIIICNPMRENEIFDELISNGLPQEKMISLVSLAFG